jgi:hypothetical protein
MTASLVWQLVTREYIPTLLAVAALPGLWRKQCWGWILALLADGILCAGVLWFLLNYA